MSRRLIVTIIFTLIFQQLHAQLNISGEVRELLTQKVLKSSYITLVDLSDTTKRKTVLSNEEGIYNFTNIKTGSYSLRATFISFLEYRRNEIITDSTKILKVIYLEENSKALDEVKVVGQVAAAIQKVDTIQFNAKAFKVNPDANADELIEKLPGAINTNGKLQIQGEDVKQVMVDGKLFFGKDAVAALKNIPSEVIDKIEIFDQLSEQSQLTGLNDGNTVKTINVTTRPDMRNGIFGRNSVGIGTDNTYRVNGSINRFNGNSRVTALLQSNNINQQNFSSEDLEGVAAGASQNRRGGGGGGGNSNTGTFLTNNQAGYNTTNAFGLNYSNEWSKKVILQGSYFLNQAINTTTDKIFQQYIQASNTSQTYNETRFSNNKTLNHRAYFRLEYKINENNSLIITPNLSIQNSESTFGNQGVTFLEQTKLNDVNNENSNKGYNINFSNSLFFRHRFSKKGRSFTFNFSNNFNNRDGRRLLKSTNNFYGTNPSARILNQNVLYGGNNWGINTNLYYTEPLSEQSFVFLSTSFDYNENQSERYAYNFSDSEQSFNRLDTLLSNVFNSDYYNYRVGTGYRFNTKEWNISTELKYQNANLINEQFFPKSYNLDKSFSNVLPSLSVRYNLDGRSKGLRFEYQTNTRQPNTNELQEVINNTNPLRLYIGNSTLSQEYQHNFSLRYTATSKTNFSNFVALMGGNLVNDNIVNSNYIANKDTILDRNIILKKGSQLARPVNLDGQYSVRGFLSYGFPLKAIKSNINSNLSANYNRTPGLNNGSINFSDAQRYSLGFVLSSNISQNFDFTISSNSNLSMIDNTLSTNFNTDFFNQNLKFRLNVIVGNGFVFNTDATYFSNSGLSSSFNQKFTLWNMSVAKKMFKKQAGEIRLSVFDLLKQNASIQRNVTNNFIEDVESNVLQQYFMLNFSYNLRKYWKS